MVFYWSPCSWPRYCFNYGCSVEMELGSMLAEIGTTGAMIWYLISENKRLHKKLDDLTDKMFEVLNGKD